MIGRKKEILTFKMIMDSFFEFIKMIKEKQCEFVAMESTGLYLKSIYNLLELENIKTIVVNVQHIKNVPSRKTDVKNVEWIADLLKHRLLKGNYIPSRG